MILTITLFIILKKKTDYLTNFHPKPFKDNRNNLLMVFNITSGTLTAMVGLVGIILGALMGPLMNHRIGLRYSRRDLIFKRKLEYFEKIVETIEKNKKIYNNSISKIESSKTNSQINLIINELKQNRQNFFVMASPLYFNVKIFSDRIIEFVAIEKDILDKISEIKDNKNKDKKIQEIKKDLEALNRKSQEIIIDMKRELAKK